MDREYTLWYADRCSTCEKALELLRQRGVEPVLRRYLAEPPTVWELEQLVARLGMEPHAIAREKEDEYEVLRLSDRTPRDEMLKALAEHPRIIQRPILVSGDRAVLGRPAERVLELVE